MDALETDPWDRVSYDRCVLLRGVALGVLLGVSLGVLEVSLGLNFSGGGLLVCVCGCLNVRRAGSQPLDVGEVSR